MKLTARIKTPRKLTANIKKPTKMIANLKELNLPLDGGYDEGYQSGYDNGYTTAVNSYEPEIATQKELLEQAITELEGKVDPELYDKGYAEGIAATKLNVSDKETLTFSKLVDANMTVLYTSSCDVEAIRLTGTRGGVGVLPVIELYDEDTLIYSGSASQSMEYVNLLPLRQSRSIYIKKTGGDNYNANFTLQTIKISQIRPISELEV